MEDPDGTLASVAQCIEQLRQSSLSAQDKEYNLRQLLDLIDIVWQATSDFTNGEASKYRLKILQTIMHLSCWPNIKPVIWCSMMIYRLGETKTNTSTPTWMQFVRSGRVMSRILCLGDQMCGLDQNFSYVCLRIEV